LVHCVRRNGDLGVEGVAVGTGKAQAVSRDLSAMGEMVMSDVTQDMNFLQGVKVVDFTQFEAGTTSTEGCAPASPTTTRGISTSSTSTRSRSR
jgi:hypothetical protein